VGLDEPHETHKHQAIHYQIKHIVCYVPQKFRDRGLSESSLFFFNIANDAHGFEAIDLIDFCDMYLKAMIDRVLYSILAAHDDSEGLQCKVFFVSLFLCC
jgi:hypothetical protein